MNPQDDPSEELLRAYEQASASEAGKPSTATRRAIMAEAAAAARRRTPAANDSRYVWRTVAGVAVLGIALLLWRQSESPIASVSTPQAMQPPSPASAVEAASVAEAATVAEADAVAVEKVAAPAASIPPQAPVSTHSESTEVAQASPRAFEEDRRVDSRLRVEMAPVADAARSVQAAGASATALVASDVLREYFPHLLDSELSRSVWMVLSSNGRLQQSGELALGQSLDDVAPGPWEKTFVINTRGKRIDIAVYRAPAP